jgi:hypothetical protein
MSSCAGRHLLLEEEQAAATDLERKAGVAKGLLRSSSSFSTMFDMIDGVTYDSTLVTNLHVQATMVPNVCQLVNIVLDTTSSNYTICPDLMLIALTRYSLVDHVLFSDAFIDDLAWIRMDAVVLCWLQHNHCRSSGGCSGAWSPHVPPMACPGEPVLR